MIIYHLFALTIAFFVDRLIGDPVWLPHPVRMIGKLITRLEAGFNRGRHRKLKGLLFLAIIVMSAFLPALFVTMIAYRWHVVAGVIVEALLIWTTIAAKGLADAADDVYHPLTEGNTALAREKLSWIVGRDTDELSESDIARAAVETVAENTSDGVTAPLFWALVGGAPLSLVYRAVNTCDSMVGYKNDRFLAFGWASAKADDVLNLIPSRFTGLMMILVNRPVQIRKKRDCFRILFRDARKHPSPNSGWGEAATAALLGVQLGGRNTYQGIVSERAKIGEAIVPISAGHIRQAVGIMRRTVFTCLLVYWIGGGIIAFAIPWFEPVIPVSLFKRYTS